MGSRWSSGRASTPSPTLPAHAIVLEDPGGRLGYFEQKLAELTPGRLIATCLTVTLGDVSDQDTYTANADDPEQDRWFRRVTG